MIKIELKDGSNIEVEKESSVLDVAKKISEGLARVALAGIVNGEVKDLRYELNEDCKLEIVTFDNLEGKKAYWHTTSHIMAQAIKRIFPEVKLAIGPSIDNGFYYDFDVEKPFTEDDLAKIENEMKKIIKEDLAIERFTLPRDEAIKFMKEKQEPYKVELIEDLPEDEEISFYKQGEFTDLCAGPHVMKTGSIKAVKLLTTSGAYWRGNEKNKMLQRIYGISYPKASQLEEYLNMLEEAKKRDHRKIGRELELFMISEYGPGFPFWLPNGMIIFNELKNFWYDEHTKAGYQFVQTPIMLNKELWEISGHWYNYRENMYTSVIDDNEFAIKPMNCPGGMLVYKNKIHSYKDLPLRVGELGLVHRHEASGALNGLFRVRTFTQDDAHIFMTKEQIKEEIANIILLYKRFYDIFNLDFTIELSTRPEEKYIGDISVWDNSEKALAEACELAGFSYKINPGDGAFYGPKLDFKLKDAIGRIWQCGTIQLDMNLPERFDLTYVDRDGSKQRPIMVHRALFGSFERFIGVITEHFAGAFPLWLSPVQINIIPVNNEYHLEYAKELKEKLLTYNFRVQLDDRDEKLSYKMRESQTKKIPYTLIIGDKEKDSNSVSYREFGSTETINISTLEFIDLLKDEIKNKVIKNK